MRKFPVSLPFLVGALVLGLIAGIVFQKYLPVGKILQKVTGGESAEIESRLEQAFVPVTPSPDPSLLRYARDTKIDIRSSKYSEALAKRLKTRIPIEAAHREQSRPAIDAIREARSSGTISEIEFQFDRIFRADDLDSFQQASGQKSSVANPLLEASRQIAEFAERLRQDGTHLLYCPVPNPLDCYLSKFLGEADYTSARPEQSEFLLSLINQGVDAIDLRDAFGKMALDGTDPFHRFDHHWTPAGIETAASLIAEELSARFDISQPYGLSDGGPGVNFRWIPIPASDWNLELAPPGTHPGTLFGREVNLGNAPMLSLPASPIWIMGDSMLLEASLVRLGISADFGSHLAARLKAPVNTLGRPGTVDIRQAYFLNTTLADSRPRILLWIHADEKVDFPAVDLDALTRATSSLEGTAKIVEVSALPDPTDSPYADAIYSLRVELQLPREQTSSAIIYTWGFQDRKLSPTAGFEAGEKVEVELTPWLEAVKANPKLGKTQLIDHLENLEGSPVFWMGESP